MPAGHARQVLEQPLTWLTARSRPAWSWPRFACMRDRRVWLAAACIFVAGVLPVLGLVPFYFQIISTVADRYIYLAMLGPALALAWFLSRHWHDWSVALTAFMLVVLAVLSHRAAGYWSDQEALLPVCCVRGKQSAQLRCLDQSGPDRLRPPKIRRSHRLLSQGSGNQCRLRPSRDQLGRGPDDAG